MADGPLQSMDSLSQLELPAESPSTPPQSRKRPATDDVASERTPASLNDAAPSSVLSSPRDSIAELIQSTNSARAVSPSLSSIASVSADPNSSCPPDGVNPSTNPPQKRRRLTPAEREQKLKEKEARKAQRDEEQRLKDEERRKKNEEREEKKREKELEKQQKEQVKQAKEQAKEEERLKKERVQPKLMAFFSKPVVSSTTITANPTLPESPAKNLAVVPDDNAQKPASPEPKAASPEKGRISDFRACFLPFSIPSYAILAPINPQLTEEAELVEARRKLDAAIADCKLESDILSSKVKTNFQSLLESCKGTRGKSVRPIKGLIAALHGSPSRPIDLTEDAMDEYEPLALIRQTSLKYLHFGEDVRPPYSGTYTKSLSRKQTRQLALNPSSRTIPEVNYDYDSEAEWEEPEEGEDIDIEDDEEEEEDGDEDMEGFLDDEEDVGRIKRGPLAGDLVPVSTGICWEDASGKLIRPDDSSDPIDMSDCRMGIILDPAPVSINPFSTTYWAPEVPPASNKLPAADQTITNMMNPPRLPLSARPNASNGVVPKISGKSSSAILGGAAPKPPKRLIAPELMDTFKSEIDGSDLTKIALVEALKKKFPKQPKDAITNTLNVVAARVGDSNATKRWKLVN